MPEAFLTLSRTPYYSLVETIFCSEGWTDTCLSGLNLKI
jgi:hypothetical protein